MKPSRALVWLVGALVAPIALATLFIIIFGWNWARGPIERMTLENTGRVLVISGDIKVRLAWPFPEVQAGPVTYANPDWAKERQMFSADAVNVSIDLPALLRKKFIFPSVKLTRPTLFLEQGAQGKKSWLLDLSQQDESARIDVGRLTLDQGMLGFDDPLTKTSIRSQLSTGAAQPDAAGEAGVTFSATGQYKGQALKAHGIGGPVLALRDEGTPYPLKIDANFGRTAVSLEGVVTSLLKFSAVDLRLKLRGDSLDQLFPLLGIALPATRPYLTSGHLLFSGNTWRYEKFSGQIGASDIAGSLKVVTGGPRPVLTADLSSKMLDLADLGPVIGARQGQVQTARQAAPPASATGTEVGPTTALARVLPDLPFKTDRWNTVDADVTLNAKAIRHVAALAIDGLTAHLSLRDSVVTLDPLDFGLAGGRLNAVISLDGRKDPLVARARLNAKRIHIDKLFPTMPLTQSGIGEVNGQINLTGTGKSVGRMLASANGDVGLVVAGGEISKLMMEKAGLHLWEILQLSLTGDKLVKVRCAVVDFKVKQGLMMTDALVFDTAVTTLIGTGSIDLAQERLDLTLNQKTKATSPVALRSPIYIRGNFAKPDVQVDTGRVVARALGAVALGVVNPLLTLIPLIDAGPGKDSDCGQLVRDAKAPLSTQPQINAK